MTLRTKFQLASTSLILIVVIGMMGSLYVSEKNQIRAQIRLEQEEELKKLSEVFNEFQLSDSELIFFNYARTVVLSDPKVAYAGHVEPTGKGWIYVRGPDQIELTDPAQEEIQEIISSKRALRREGLSREGERVVELTIPVKEKGYVRLAYSQDEVDGLFNRNLRENFVRFLVVGLVVIIFGLFLVQIFTAALSRPIDQLMKAALQIAKGKKGIQIPERDSSDELGRLTKTFNRMSRELSKLDELKDDFMSHVSHELRSPLTSIIATVELLAENPLASKDPKFKRSIDRLIYGSERLNRLVDNILDLTKLEAGKMHFDIQPTNMAKLIAEMADFFEPRAMEKGLKIKAVVKKNLPAALADAEKVRQIISNLVHNAIKFTNSGGIVISAQESDGFLQVAVQDTGVGIPEDKKDQIFEKFESLKDTKDRVDKPVPGSGLGLNIVKNSIKAMGGKIWIESEVDKGSTFIFTLPIDSKFIANNKKVSKPSSASNASSTGTPTEGTNSAELQKEKTS